MKKFRKVTVVFILLISILVQSINLRVVFAEAKEESVTILFTHDMHDNFLPLKSKNNSSVAIVGGYTKLQSAINQQKEADPEALLLDAGDYSMGTPFQTIYMSDAPELRLMGQMGYDVVTFGNHEYDYRAAGLAKSLTAATTSNDKLPEVVQSNVSFPADKEGNYTETLTQLKQAMETYGVKDYTVLERKGIKIGIFGLMGEESASMAPMSEVVFTDEVKEAKRVVKILKEQEKVDLILCLSHSGTDADPSISEDEILAKEVPDIDIIISGHSHTILPQPIIIGDTIIGSAEDYGKNLGVIKVKQDSEGDWVLSNYELVAINDRFTEDTTIASKIEEFQQLVQEKYFDKFGMKSEDVVAYSEFQLETPEEIAATHAEAKIGNLISDAYIYAVKKAEGDNYIPIDAAIVPCGNIRGTIFPGNITTADAFSISSLGIGADGMPGYPLISVYLTGKELKTACEVDASIAPIMDDAQLYMSGVNFTFNPNRLLFNKVTKTSLVKEDGSEAELEDTKLYRTVCSLYSAQMLSVVGDKSYGLMSIIPKTKDGEVITDFEAQIIYDNNSGLQSELKEWYAVVQYLQSFEKTDGVAKVPAAYSKAQGRKIVDDNHKLTAILSNPNRISLTVYILIPSVFVLIFVIIVLAIRRRKHKKAGKRN